MPKTTTPVAKKPSEDKLSAYLSKLATDYSELGHFIRDPDGSMDQAGLSAQDQALLKSGNAAAINSRLRGEPVPQAPPPLLLVDLGPDGKPSVRETTTPHIVGTAFHPGYTSPHIVGTACQPYVAPHIVGAAAYPSSYAAPHIVGPAMQPPSYAPPPIVSTAFQPAYGPHIVGAAVHPASYAAPHIVGPAFQPAYLAPHIVNAAVQQPIQNPYWQQPPAG
jgi:hypothetical protein